MYRWCCGSIVALSTVGTCTGRYATTNHLRLSIVIIMGRRSASWCRVHRCYSRYKLRNLKLFPCVRRLGLPLYLPSTHFCLPGTKSGTQHAADAPARRCMPRSFFLFSSERSSSLQPGFFGKVSKLHPTLPHVRHQQGGRPCASCGHPLACVHCCRAPSYPTRPKPALRALPPRALHSVC